ncbi:MAG TPA: lipoyl(octanoyl) transferase LipB [Phycisphaerae bacterium]|nr:lipoyl(octanoyl) transferase LipB [Phycisphaerae bacterium]
MRDLLQIVDAGRMPYRPAWDLQLQLHQRVLAEEADYAAGVLMLVEHPPVITIGRRANAQQNLLASPKMLELRGVEVVETDRGGDITFHGPGQLVAYPIINLNRYGLNLHAYMRFLEEAVIRTLGQFEISGERSEGATGVWVRDPRAAASPDGLAKICAIGVKLRRWVTFHGIALNVTTDLSFFDLINPCGLGRPVTSMQRLLPRTCPAVDQVKRTLVDSFNAELAAMPQK